MMRGRPIEMAAPLGNGVETPARGTTGATGRTLCLLAALSAMEIPCQRLVNWCVGGEGAHSSLSRTTSASSHPQRGRGLFEAVVGVRWWAR